MDEWWNAFESDFFLIELYFIARCFRQKFKHSDKFYYGAPSNIIFYGGAAHVVNIEKYLVSLGGTDLSPFINKTQKQGHVGFTHITSLF